VPTPDTGCSSSLSFAQSAAPIPAGNGEQGGSWGRGEGEADGKRGMEAAMSREDDEGGGFSPRRSWRRGRAAAASRLAGARGGTRQRRLPASPELEEDQGSGGGNLTRSKLQEGFSVGITR
jgi:hypothetical protein